MTVSFSSVREPLFPVAERFVSINGEGPKAGQPAAFIRMKGCNLSCNYCDTSWANKSDCPCEQLTISELSAWLKEQQVRNVTLTGGEPLMTEGIGLLAQAIGQLGMEVEIETNGSIDILPFCHLPCRPAFTIDYKCPDSGMEEHMLLENYSLLKDKDAVKFVVSSKEDLDTALFISRKYRLSEKCPVFLSPVFGRIEAKEIVHYMLDHQWNDARLQLQMHKYIWSPSQRGV